jgi:SAM-dependent methyltransferase
MIQPRLEATQHVTGIPYPVYDAGLRFYEQTRRIGMWPIPHGRIESVVDVGCGHVPFPYANVLVDREPSLATERFGWPIPRDDRPLIAADLERGLPFANRSVDFMYCSHVLEHCEHPDAACGEILRVAKAGFIETPSLTFELILGGDEHSPHRWVTEYDDRHNLLTFRRLSGHERRIIERRIATGNAISRLLRDPLNPWRCHSVAYWKNQEMFTNCFLWNDTFQYQVLF